jgi:DNA polymerase-3 subunit epsilon
LLDAQLLAEVYIGLTSGQSEIGFEASAEATSEAAAAFEVDIHAPRPRVVVAEEDLAAHENRLAQLRKKAGKAVWDMWAEADAAAQVEAVPA